MANEMIRGIPFDFEPKRENRFIAQFPSELGIEEWKVQSFKRPSIDLSVVDIPYMNGFDYVTGKARWEQMDITFLDTIGPSTSIQLMEWVRSHYESLTGRAGYAKGYKKNILLKSLGPAGVAVEKWRIEKAQIVSVDFGQNDHGGEDIQKVTVTIQPWRCILEY